MRGGQRRARRVSVDLRDPTVRVGRIDPLPRRGEVNGLSVVRPFRAHQRRPKRLRVPVLHADRADGHNAANLRRDHPASLNGAIRDGRRIRRRVTVGRRVVDVDAAVARSRDHRESTRLGAVNRALGGLEGGGLLGVRRVPVHPRVHLVGVVDDVHLVGRRPLVGAHEGLGVEQIRLVECLDGHERCLRRDAVNTDVVVVGGDHTSDVGAVLSAEPPGILSLVRDAVDGARDGPGGVHPSHQVGLRVVDASVDDADGHGRTGHGNLGSAPGIHGLGTPVRAGRTDPAVRVRDRHGRHVGRVRGWHVRGGLSGGGLSGGSSCRGCGRRVAHGTLALRYGGHAGRADGVNAHPGLRQGGGHVGRERGRLTLGEQGAQLRVAGQKNAADAWNQVGGAGHLALPHVGVKVNGVVHEARSGSGGRDQADVIVGAGRRGGRRSHAHGQSEGRDEANACNCAAHGSSTFTCHCA